MAFRKFGSIEILAAAQGAIPMPTLGQRTGHRAVFQYVPKPGMLYVRSRAISSRCNDNFDMFPAEEIKQAYGSFVGKPVFVNHVNEDHRQMRGVIIDAALHEDRNPNGTPDTWVEVLMEVDGHTYPKLAKAILAGDIDRTSMGCDVKISKCSVCHNEATSPLEYCSHIPGKKGQRIYRAGPDGRREGVLVFEVCSGLSFFENSLLVEPPADPTAFFLGKVDIGPGLEHLVASVERKTARINDVLREAHQPPVTITPTPQMARYMSRTAARSLPANPMEQKFAEAFERARAALSTEAAQGQSKADQFFEENQPSAHHIVERFLSATPQQHDAGMNWYKDSHEIARSLGGKTKKGTAKAAGLMGVYSAGTPVAPNYHYASRALIHNTPVGGTSDINVSGIPEKHRDFHGLPNANDDQRTKAARMLAGEHHSTVLNSPKVSNYAHLIEHGDDEKGHDGPERVVVDRHAVSAAIGRRITDNEFNSLALGSNDNGKRAKDPQTNKYLRTPDKGYIQQDHGNDMNPRYKKVADAYREATRQLRGMGHDVKAHQVQAVAWTVQKSRNDAEDDAHVASSGPQAGNIKGRQTSQTRQRDAWEQHYDTSRPKGHRPADPRLHWGKKQLIVIGGYRYEVRFPKVAYGETKAPMDVDTLRDERCAICGNDTAYNGRECQVCGYMAPPKALGDPDVDKAKNLDSLKQSISDDLDEADPSRNGAEFDPGDTDAIGAIGGDDPNSSWLECSACGTSVRPAAPTTIGGDPQEDSPAGGPTEGDVCPVCQKGELLNSGVSEDETDEEAMGPEGATDDEEDGSEPGNDQTPVKKGEVDSDDTDSDDDDESDDEKDEEEGAQDDDTPASSSKKLPASKNSATAKYRHPVKERQMNQALAALTELQSLVEYQQHENRKMSTRLSDKDSQIQRLTAGLQQIAQLLGPEADAIVRTAMIRKRADEQNPAQPIPEPAPEAPVNGTVDAKTPEAFADVRAPGMVPGTNQDVAADAVSTAYTPGQDIPSPAVKNLVDVTRPIDGTQGPRPLSETKTNVDVRVGNPMNPQTAFPLNGPFNEAQRTASNSGTADLRFMASMRLARLQIQAGLDEGDDLVVAQKIASSQMTVPEINHETALLNNFSKAAAKRQQQAVAPARASVPRPAVQRTVPALSGDTLQVTAGLTGSDEDLSFIFTGDL